MEKCLCLMGQWDMLTTLVSNGHEFVAKTLERKEKWNPVMRAHRQGQMKCRRGGTNRGLALWHQWQR